MIMMNSGNEVGDASANDCDNDGCDVIIVTMVAM